MNKKKLKVNTSILLEKNPKQLITMVYDMLYATSWNRN